MSMTSGDIAPPTAIIGRNVRAELIRRGRTQDAVATCLGISQAAVSKRLNGRTPFDVNELVKVARLLDVPLSTLFAGVELEVPA